MERNSYRGMAFFVLAVSLLAGAASGLGVFARGTGTTASTVSIRGEAYDYVTTGVYAYNAQRVVAEGIGWDIFTLFIAVPALLIATRLILRGSFRGRLFAVGLFGYLFYQYLMYAVTWALGPLFPLFIVIYALSLVGIAWFLASLVREGLTGRFSGAFPRLGIALLCFFMAAVLVLLWGQRIAAGLRGDWKTAMLFGGTTLVVQALDLGIIVPLAVACGVLVLRRRPAGYLLSSIVVVKMVAMAAAICAMLVSAAVVEKTLEVGPFVLFAAVAVLAAVLGIRMYGSIPPQRSGT
jgi:hypothetical protein